MTARRFQRLLCLRLSRPYRYEHRADLKAKARGLFEPFAVWGGEDIECGFKAASGAVGVFMAGSALKGGAVGGDHAIKKWGPELTLYPVKTYGRF